MSIRILHTADWQIGKGFGRIPGDDGAILRDQRIQTVKQIAELARAHEVDAVLVAGDVFEQQTVSERTIRQCCEALAGYAGPWVLLPGNHDAALADSVWTRLAALGSKPKNLHLALTPEPFLLAQGKLAVLPAPLVRRHEPEDLTAWFDTADTPAAALRIGLAHGTVRNRLPAQADLHNPIADDRCNSARLDYLALGDWHGSLHIADKTWYAGTPETDSFRGNEPGNVLLVSIEAPGAQPQVTAMATSHFQWHALEESVTSDAGLEALDSRLAGLGEPADRCVVRLRLTGSLTLGQRQRLDAIVERWRARFRYLDLDLAALQATASAQDLAALRGQGFIGTAVDRLLALHDDSAHPDQPYAMAALQRLYSEQAQNRS